MLFTIKDFIKYNGPCFNCRRAISFFVAYDRSNVVGDPIRLQTKITKNYLYLTLRRTYAYTINLVIHHKTNRIMHSSRIKESQMWLSGKDLSLNSYCPNCQTTIISQPLQFNWDRNYIEAAELHTEYLMIETKSKRYLMDNNFLSQATNLSVSNIGSSYTFEPVKFNLPLMPKYSFQNKQEMIEKCQLITLLA